MRKGMMYPVNQAMGQESIRSRAPRQTSSKLRALFVKNSDSRFCRGLLSLDRPVRAAEHQGGKAGGDGCCQQAVQPVEQAAMAGNEVARVLHPEMALGERFGKVAELGHHRKAAADQGQSRRRSARQPGGDESYQRRAEHATGEAGPRLVRAEPRRELGPADAAPGGVSADI